MDVSDQMKLTREVVNNILDGLQSAKIAILCVDSTADVPENRVNMIVELSKELSHRFVLKYLQVIKSDSQEFYQGQHQYKSVTSASRFILARNRICMSVDTCSVPWYILMPMP